MNDKAEKVYADAFFTLCLEETPDTLKNTLGELSALDGIFREQPDFVKLLGTPTVTMDEKLGMIRISSPTEFQSTRATCCASSRSAAEWAASAVS